MLALKLTLYAIMIVVCA